MPIRLQESQRALFYAPFYAALAREAFRDVGLSVTFKSAGASPSEAVENVISGNVDVAWGGPMRLMVDHDRQGATGLVCFGEAVSRDPFCLIGRAPREDFTLHMLSGLRIGAVREVPTPWQCLQEDLRSEGIDPARMNVNFELTMDGNAVALSEGRLDVVQTMEPLAEVLIQRGCGFLWHSAARRGPTTYTCFYARRELLSEKRGECVELTSALYSTQQWLCRAPAEEIVDTIKTFFPSIPKPILTNAIARYKGLEVWGCDPRVSRSGYEQLKRSLLSGGLISKSLPFDAAVDNTIAEDAVEARC